MSTLGRALAWAAACVAPQARVVRSTPIAGGMTGSVFALDVIDANARLHRLVLKLYTPDPEEPASPKRESRILDLLRESDLTVPRVIAIDPQGLECEMPALLMTRLPGRPRVWPRDIKQWIHDLATCAAQIHATPIASEALPTYRRYEWDKPPAPRVWSKKSSLWEKAIDAYRAPAPDHKPTFIHRDFHAGNVLWSEGEVRGIVDWLHGCWGPPEQDLAHCRFNLWLNQGPAAADALVAAYRRAAPSARPYHPYWDLDEALGNHDPATPPGNASAYESFIAAAVANL
ncbi:MAG: aminoglycoside phosphotransferase family protein [Candidatus Dormibacteraeota bacterium]|nr:aminoglycoside phosphotransferase family protein [Candidatus Dormibacteraeota bacterium]